MTRAEFVNGLRERWRNVLQKTQRVAVAQMEVKKWAPDSMPRFSAEQRLAKAEEDLDAALCEVGDFIYDTVPAHPVHVGRAPITVTLSNTSARSTDNTTEATAAGSPALKGESRLASDPLSSHPSACRTRSLSTSAEAGIESRGAGEMGVASNDTLGDPEE